MENEKLNKQQSPEEIAKAAQEAAIKAAMEQTQAMFGNIPGFDMGDIQAQIMAQMQAAVPNMAEIQAQQAAMGTLGGVDTETVRKAGQQNMSDAFEVMQEMQTAGMDYDFGMEDEEWELNIRNKNNLSNEQKRLLAFGAPLLVYNDEYLDTIEEEEYIDSLKEQIRSWWNVTDRDSTLEIVEWLLNEGHHAYADMVIASSADNSMDNLPEEAQDKVEDVELISQYMTENGLCSEDSLPKTAIAWDLVRIVNLGRWAYQCGYIPEEDMWNIMRVAEEAAMEHFSSWEEYGMSFTFGRGVWHGDTMDCQTAHEIVSSLLKKTESPWLNISWN